MKLIIQIRFQVFILLKNYSWLMVIVIGLKACEHFGAQVYVCEINMNFVSLVVILSTKIHKNRTPEQSIG